MAGFLDNIKNNKALTLLSKNLSKISKLGMDYQDMIIKNSQAIGKTESGFTDSEGSGATISEAFRWISSLQDTSIRKYIAYFDKDYRGKRDFLRKFSLNGEIEFILDVICDDIIIKDTKNFFAYPQIVNSNIRDNVKDDVYKEFKNIYHKFGFARNNLAWQYMRQFLIDGFLALEIIYDDKVKNIIGFKELDPTSLKPVIEKKGENRYEQYWIQYPDVASMTRKLKDEQIIYLSYAKGNSISRVSYIERLVRSYNILRIMENTRIIWNVMNASYRLKFIVPIGTQSPQKAHQTLGELMSFHKEEIEINDASGELTINGRPKIQFYKNYLFPEKNGESPTVETLNPSGPDLDVMESVTYFFNKLKQDSKIPYARFAARASTPFNHQIDITQMERDEIRFDRFLNRLRSNFKELLLKPLFIQMCLKYPELSNDHEFKTDLGLEFVRESEFEVKFKLKQLTKRAGIVSKLLRIEDGGEAYFDLDFLIKKFLGLDLDEIEANKRYKEIMKKVLEEREKEEAENQEEQGADSGDTGGFTL